MSHRRHASVTPSGPCAASPSTTRLGTTCPRHLQTNMSARSFTISAHTHAGTARRRALHPALVCSGNHPHLNRTVHWASSCTGSPGIPRPLGAGTPCGRTRGRGRRGLSWGVAPVLVPACPAWTAPAGHALANQALLQPVVVVPVSAAALICTRSLPPYGVHHPSYWLHLLSTVQ